MDKITSQNNTSTIDSDISNNLGSLKKVFDNEKQEYISKEEILSALKNTTRRFFILKYLNNLISEKDFDITMDELKNTPLEKLLPKNIFDKIPSIHLNSVTESYIH